MAERQLMTGNEALAEAAIRAGCRTYFGYPITPQNEILEYMAAHLPKAGGAFLQAESEVAAINMCYGAAAAGVRTMTSSSSPGISLKLEGISYLAGADLPCLIINVARGGPGLGNIAPAQGDYFQAVKGGGHGDYRLLVFAPANLQEAVDLVTEAFDLADLYRNPVLILGDGLLGQMMEPVEFRKFPSRELPPKTWATTGMRNHPGKNIVNSLVLDAPGLEQHNLRLQAKYARIQHAEQRAEILHCDDAELVIVAYGSTARIAKTAVANLRQAGVKVGLFRPITLWPFPAKALGRLVSHVKALLAVEMSAGQMVEDVQLVVNGAKPVHFYGRMGGMVPTPEEISAECLKVIGGDR